MPEVKESPRVAVYGLGAMGLEIVRILYRRHARVVAGIVRPGSDKDGRDLGDLAGVPGLTFPARGDASQALHEAAPDIVVVTVSTYLDDTQFGIFSTAVRAGAHVITLAEEMLYPFATDNPLARELDTLAREHGVTVTGTGYQDAYWVNLISVLAGSTHDLGGIEGRLAWNVDDFGPALAEQQRVGTTTEDFSRWLALHRTAAELHPLLAVRPGRSRRSDPGRHRGMRDRAGARRAGRPQQGPGHDGAQRDPSGLHRHRHPADEGRDHALRQLAGEGLRRA